MPRSNGSSVLRSTEETVLRRGPADHYILDALQDQDKIEEILNNAGTMDLLGQRLEGFYAFTRSPALVTSRIAGYDDAPLADAGPDACVHLQLVPFSDEELNAFVTHWYNVQEPLDPKARDKGIADLAAAIEASERSSTSSSAGSARRTIGHFFCSACARRRRSTTDNANRFSAR